MARNKKVYDDDDGRTIADMSGVAPHPMLLPKFRTSGEKTPQKQTEKPLEDRPWESGQNQLTREEQRWVIFGALKAALLIALAFIVGIGLLILILILAWG